ncbi:hypothetical protein PVAP13_3KG230827 [Panicum virgatum]|uniref:Uncharacterized protein n=1 Tax=Panicum virgatum TaxID=38727 RepID=A0A8T0V155_PANVG|nr:hypothetical protein PVAP13_3KG230827 [Panicum virgatum]
MRGGGGGGCGEARGKNLPWFWKRSGELVTKFGLNAENEIIHTLAFLAGAMVWS